MFYRQKTFRADWRTYISPTNYYRKADALMIYFDNAATTMVMKEAADGVLYAMSEAYGNPSSLHTPGQLAVFYDGDTVLGSAWIT